MTEKEDPELSYSHEHNKITTIHRAATYEKDQNLAGKIINN